MASHPRRRRTAARTRLVRRKAVNAIEGSGACTFTARAFADLDNDAVFSTYERRGTADHRGVQIDPDLYVTLAGE